MALWKIGTSAGSRLALGPADSGPECVLADTLSIDDLLGPGVDFQDFRSIRTEPLPHEFEVLPPLESQEVWASGVTFEESRYARESESTQSDFYRDVYFADRPELFLKATVGTAVGPGEAIAIRSDSDWNVPEPEVGLVSNADGILVALTLGNDVSSRSIEGTNPLYLPQAKIYDASCSIGPCLVPLDEAFPLLEHIVRMSVHRGGSEIFAGECSLASLTRTAKDLVDWLYRARTYPNGVVLLTGTGVIPPDKFTLREGDVVEIWARGLGRLVNPVRTTGTGAAR